MVEGGQLLHARLALQEERAVEARVVDVARLRMVLDEVRVRLQGLRRAPDVAVGFAEAEADLVARQRLDVPNCLVLLQSLGVEPPLRQLVGEGQAVRGKRGGQLRRKRQGHRPGEQKTESLEHRRIV